VGGTLGHALCAGLAVVGGRMLAAKIREKSVATIGGVTFLAFAAHSFLFPDAFD
jgi:putative Ca2+/H+ antiporter (TMEM165/GDT1 family)